jgi:wobble nucleotide-excising tRNase
MSGVMILRIKKINQIGRFKNFNTGGSVSLGNNSDNKRISVILGENTYGKSTITDILKSANANDSTLIKRRLSIPHANVLAQEVELTYKNAELPREENIIYNLNGWSNNLLTNKLLIFDQEFIYRNIFTGVNITRENKEGFTDFILGEDGARLGDEIETRKKTAGKFPSELKNLRPEYVKNATDENEVKAFIDLVVRESNEELIEKINKQRNTIERLDKTVEFFKLPVVEYKNSIYQTQCNQLFELLSNISVYSYENVSKDAMAQVQKQFEYIDGAWLEKGIKYFTNDICPFCTQKTTTVSTLIDAYRIIFDEKYDQYVNEVNFCISSVKTLLNNLSTTIISNDLNKTGSVISKYLPFIDELNDISDTINIKLEELRTTESIMRKRIIENMMPKVEVFLSEKQANIHKKNLVQNDIYDIKKISEESDVIIYSLHDLINKCLIIINKKHDEIKTWTSDVIAAKKNIANGIIIETERKKMRLIQESQCIAYKEMQEMHKQYKIETTRLQNLLKIEQTNYLERLFASINSWFIKLGSNDFTLDCKQSVRGNKTVYELRILFRKMLIREDNLSKVFSDSDRRSLALSVFMARAESLDMDKTILVLDDPVVSFDNNRIKQICYELKDLSSRFEQIIILTHYKILIQQLLLYKTDANYSKIEIVSGDSVLESFETDDYLLSDHEKDYLHLASFINGDSNDTGMFLQLRPFMERHIDIIYQPDLIALNLIKSSLNEKINGLINAHIITEDVANKLHNYREILNPDHHNDFRGMSKEDYRLFVKSVLEDLYKL